MGDVVNLNRFRKGKRRNEQVRQAAANRVRHGQTKVEKLTAARENDRQSRQLDGQRLDDSAKDPDSGSD